MDAFIDTITRTSIFSGLAREDLARDQIAYFGTGEQGFSHAQGRRFMVAKLAVSLLAIVISVPWWRALGLIP